MNSILAFLLTVLIYPGVVVAFVAAWLLSWVRQTATGALSGSPIANPWHAVSELGGTVRRVGPPPAGVHRAAIALSTNAALLCPLLALVLLPVPGNPLVSAIGLTGDLIAEGALLLGLPVARLALGWAIPSPTTRLAADRSARLLAGALLPMVLGLAVNAQENGALGLVAPVTHTAEAPIVVITRLLALAAFGCALPVLARLTPLREHQGDLDLGAAELDELSGLDLVVFRVGEAVQLAAVAGFFVAAFIVPLLRVSGGAQSLTWLVGLLATAAAIGSWEGIHGQARVTADQPPLSWWSGVPMLLGLAALVAAAWAGRGV